MMSEIEVWKTYPEFSFIDGSTLGRVRTTDRYVKTKNGKRLIKGHILKQQPVGEGYLRVHFNVNGQDVYRLVHRIISSCFIPNPDNFPEVNHRNNDKTCNEVNNLEWCSREYNIQYREKYGTSATEVSGCPMIAVNLSTQEVLHFHSQNEAGHRLGICVQNINMVIRGKRKQAGGYWFTEDDGRDFEIDKDKLRKINSCIQYKGFLVAIYIATLEVLCFESQKEAGRQLGICAQNINAVANGRQKTAGGFWFTNADNNTVESVRTKFGEKVAHEVEKLMKEKMN